MKQLTKLWTSMLTIPSVLIVPGVLISCSYNIEQSSLNRTEQLELIKNNAKTNVLNEWLTATFSTLYVNKVLNESKPNGNESQQMAAITYFLLNLEWDSTNTSVDKTKQEELEKTVYNAYKFLVTFRSTVKTGTEDIASPANYFFTKAIKWKDDKLTTVDGKPLTNFNPPIGVLPTQQNASDWSKDTDFPLLFKAWGTEIYSDVLKLLVGQMYFLQASEKEIKAGTDYNKQTQNRLNKNWLDATAFDVQDRFYFLNKYLVTKNPQFRWEFPEDKEAGFVRNIEDFNDFNTLMGAARKELNPILVPKSSDKLFNKDNTVQDKAAKDLGALRNFTKVDYESSITDGDLDTNQDNIKTFGLEKSGLLDKNNGNVLVAFQNLTAVQKIKTAKKDTANNKGQNLGLPKITLKTNSAQKTVKEITIDDFEMSFKNNTSPVKENGKLVLKDNGNNQSWELTKFAFAPQTTDKNSEQRLKLSLKYKFQDPTNGTTAGQTKENYELLYSFDLTWTPDSKTVSSIFDKDFTFDSTNSEIDKMFPEFINSQQDSKLDFRYILRPLPIFEYDGKSIDIDKQAYMTGKFSLENTIWTSNTTNGAKDDSAKIGLINWFILSDDNLWKSIQDFYLFNNYNIEAKNSEFASVISELGLNKKTEQDRKDAGIKF